jgi:hypothetical protein
MMIALIYALVLLVIGLLYVFRQSRLRISAFAKSASLGTRSKHDAAFAIARAIFCRVTRSADPIFISPLLTPLGGSPSSILDHGGCCSGIHRLFIAALDTLGIRAAQITLYQGEVARHCLAQVEVDSGVKIVIDVDYGVWFKHPNGGALDLAALRAGVIPTIVPFVIDQKATVIASEKGRPAGYPDNDYHRYTYSATRTANWTKNAFRRATYRVLDRLTKGRVDVLLLPAVLEWPHVLLAGLVGTLALALIVAHTAH